MISKILVALTLCVGLVSFAGHASATAPTVSYTCSNSAGDHLQTNLNGTGSWSSVNGGGAGTHTPVAGDTIALSGECLGDIIVTTSGLTFLGVNNDCFGSGGNDGVDGMFEVSSASIVISCLVLESVTSALNPAHNSTQSAYPEVGTLLLHHGAQVQLKSSIIGPSPVSGVVVRDASLFEATISFIQNNGSGGFTAAYSTGITAESGSTVVLGVNDGSDRAMSVTGNGTYSIGACNGYDILVNGASAHLFETTIGGQTSSTGGSCGEIVAQAGSTVRARDLALKHFGGQQNGGAAVQAIGNSTVWIDINLEAHVTPTGSSLTGFADSSAPGMILAAVGSSIILQDTKVSTPSATQPTVEAAENSSLMLAGGNTICAGTLSGNTCTATTGATAVQIDHSSSLMQQAASRLGYTAAADAITGAGIVQQQSSMDLGQGLISSNPSMIWSLGGGALTVQQNSSFRLSGGIAISNGNVRLQQGSNGFFNTANGGTNAANIVCVSSANDPGVHVTGTFTGTVPNQTNTSVTPNFPVYTLNDIMTGVSGATHPGQTNACLSF